MADEGEQSKPGESSSDRPAPELPPLEPALRRRALDVDRDTGEVLATKQHLSVFRREALAPRWFLFWYIATAAACVYILGSWINDLILAGVLIALFRPTFDSLRARTGREWLSSGLVIALIVVVVAVPLIFLVMTLAREATSAYGYTFDKLQEGETGPRVWVEQVQSFAARYGIQISPEQVTSFINEGAAAVRGTVLKFTTNLLNNALSAMVHFSVILVVVFYMLVDGGKFKDFIFDLSPLPNEEEELLVERFGKVSRGILLGNGIGSVAQGAFAGIAMAVVGLPSPVLWATVMSLFAFLPLVGVSIVVVPATVYLFLVERYVAAIGFFVVTMAWSVVMENLVKTKLIGRGTRMHDLVVFMSVMGGLSAFGILGLLYGPLIVAAFLTMTDLYRTHYRQELAKRFSRQG